MRTEMRREEEPGPDKALALTSAESRDVWFKV